MKLAFITERAFVQGWDLLVALEAEGFPVKAAFWSRVGEGEEWRLFIASPIVDEQGPLKAYQMIQSVFPNIKSSNGLTVFKLAWDDISVIGLKSELFKQVKTEAPWAIKKTSKKLSSEIKDLSFLAEKLIYKLGS